MDYKLPFMKTSYGQPKTTLFWLEGLMMTLVEASWIDCYRASKKI